MKYYMYSVFVLAIALLFHILGNAHGWYVKIDAYDIYMHIWTGIGIGFLALGLMKHWPISKKRKLLFAIIFSLFGGLLWECFEAYYDIAGAPVWTKAYYIDTVKDLFDDMLGASLAVLSLRYGKQS